MSIGRGTRMLSQRLLSRSAHPTKAYSPECVEGEFSEVCISSVQLLSMAYGIIGS
jgi:hypothetical protein